MILTSIDFICFLAIVVSIYYSLPHRFRWLLLLAASYYFYISWEPGYAVLLLVSTIIDFTAGLLMGKASTKSRRKVIFLAGIIFNVGLLFIFKYYNFFADSLKSLTAHFNIFFPIPHLNLLLPIGISYYTFKKIGYLIEVYRQNQEPEKHFGRFALYVSFFPGIVAGPIDRAKKLLPQFAKRIDFDYQQVTDGLKLMAWGFFKKLVIADRLAVYVNQVFNHLGRYEGVPLILAVYCFSFQVYCDFSGYTDIAIGAGKIMGFRMMENFDRPYLARSVPDFWKRWHISLTSWLMEYLFLPIAYAVSGKIKSARLLHIKAETWSYFIGVICTMLLCGIWHGAAWTFVFWGLLHGVYLLLSYITKKTRKGIRKSLKIRKNSILHKCFGIFITFNLVSFSWIFFRAKTFSHAEYVIKHLFTGVPEFIAQTVSVGLSPLRLVLEKMGITPGDFIIVVIALGILFLAELLSRDGVIFSLFSKKPVWLRWSIYYLIVFYIYFFGKFTATEFLYARF